MNIFIRFTKQHVSFVYGAILLASIAALFSAAPWLSGNIRNVCLVRFAVMQTGAYEQDSLILLDVASNDRTCGSHWREYIETSAQTEIFVTAEQLYQGRGRLGKLSPEAIAAGNYSFDSFVKLSMSHHDHQAFVTLDIPAGVYQLQIHGKHDRPGPVILNVYAAHKHLGSLEFGQDDDSWETKSLLLLPIHWPEPGESEDELTIRIRFANAGVPQRVAYIAWLRIAPLPMAESK